MKKLRDKATNKKEQTRLKERERVRQRNGKAVCVRIEKHVYIILNRYAILLAIRHNALK